nr:hypothetical protein [Paracoccus mutanolyticus]
MQALTKYAGGHSDILMGSVAVRETPRHQPQREIRTARNCRPSPAAATIAVAPRAPMPGMVTRRLTASCWLA